MILVLVLAKPGRSQEGPEVHGGKTRAWRQLKEKSYWCNPVGNSWAERDRRLRATGSAPLSASMFGRGELIPSPRTPHESMLGAPAEGSRRACTNIFSVHSGIKTAIQQ